MRRIAPIFMPSSRHRYHVREKGPSTYWRSLCGGVVTWPFCSTTVQWEGDEPPEQVPNGVCKHCWRRLRREWREYSAERTGSKEASK